MPIVSSREFLKRPLDYLIVGGGTAGLCLAARLSEDRDTIVGVLEAGEYNPNVSDIDVPGFIGRAVANSAYDWRFLSEDQPHVNGRKMQLPQGKGLGGSSQVNEILFELMHTEIMPSKDEYDAIEELGNKGWNWHSLLEATTRVRDHHILSIRLLRNSFFAEPGFPCCATQPALNKNPICAKLFDALENLRVPRNSEPGGGFTVGSAFVYNTVDPRTATRSSAATGYYAPNAKRANFMVLTGAQATKRRAIGVEFMKDGSSLWAAVTKDVILSAGTSNPCELCILSGIGNPKILERHGVKTLVDLPGVGENLRKCQKDHVMAFTVAEIDASLETVDVLLDVAEAERHAELYKEQKGLLSTLQAPAYVFVPASKLGDAQAWRDTANVQCDAYLASIDNPQLRAGLTRQYEIQKRWFCDENHAQGEVSFYNGHFPVLTIQPKPGKRYMTLNASILHPFSRGSVHIRSSNPLEPPAIDPQYFSNSVDLELLIHTVKLALKLYETEPLTALVKKDGLVFPTKDDLEGDGLKAFVKDTCSTVYHPLGTAAMMLRELGGVVDNTLRVYGTDNLRVVRRH
ncbi:GMC oxidoreductase [Guyanagaster necrorhizus]|uniref:GMC oxidoreductase n=1 Tax=Guyanagaster necrorhizus TaxID=856835 RepID=A0A9P7VV92_9AGAR|nr:GMC oxidoreductase [Guyanagaster necrorhizus MCA 3950]KAG7448156.1 GMC oxidoreductase [Guyanagaster necrorhizus MCA 3950]